MCIAIYKPAGEVITKEVLRICAENNDDGCGFSYINTDNNGVRRIKVKRSLDFEQFYTWYERAIRISPESPFLIHFRIKTHGPINIENCHPFKIDRDHVFIHNGMIKGMTTDKDRSDTNRFNMDFLQHLSGDWFQNDGVLKMIEHIIDYGKIVLMNIGGDVQICNESKGEWKDGSWFSNTSYKEKKTTYNYATGWSNNNNNNKSTVKKNTGGYNRHLYSLEPCHYCGKYFQLHTLTSFFDGELYSYCPDCAPKVEKEFSSMMKYEITDDCHVDYLNEPDKKESDTEYYDLKEWINPWESNEEKYDDMNEDIDAYYQETKLIEYNEDYLDYIGH